MQPMVSCLAFFFLLTVFQLQANPYHGCYRPICAGVILLNSSEALLTWIPPVVSDGKVLRYQVLYDVHGASVAERTLDNSLIIPVDKDASHVNAIVRTITPSDVETDRYQKGPNECEFQVNLSAIFRHMQTDSGTHDSLAPTIVGLFPISPNMTQLEWQSSTFASDRSVYQIFYTYGKEVMNTTVEDSNSLELPIEEGAMGVEAQVAAIYEDKLYRSERVFLELSEDGPDVPIYVDLSRADRETAILSWQPPRNEHLTIESYEVLYNFDNRNSFHIKETRENTYSIKIPHGMSILAAAVGVIPKEVGGSAARQVSTAYSSFKYLELRGYTDQSDYWVVPAS